MPFNPSSRPTQLYCWWKNFAYSKECAIYSYVIDFTCFSFADLFEVVAEKVQNIISWYKIEET